jgi:archaellum biogenesis ATPase FlaH
MKSPPPNERPIDRVYDYTNEEGKVTFQVVRFGDGLAPKFMQRKPTGTWNIQGVKRVLYRLPEVQRANEVWLCEGEKDANSVCALGFVATTNPMGAGNWLEGYTETLRDKDVIILPDNDEPGIKHAKEVARALHETARTLKVVRLRDLPRGGDVTDFIEAIGDPEGAAEKLSRIVEDTRPWHPIQDNPLRVQTIDDLLKENLPDNYLVDGLISEEECGFIAGGSKSGKSIFAQNLAMSMAAGHKFLNTFEMARPLKILYLNLEISKKNFQRRFKRMKESCEFSYPDKNLIHITQKGLKLDNQQNFKHLEEQVVYHRPDVVIIDCLYMSVRMSLDKHDTTAPFLDKISRLIEQYKCSVIIIHHYRKPSRERMSAHGAGEMLGSFALHAYGDFYITFKQDSKMRNKLTLDFEMRNCEEPPQIIAIRNPETLWYEYGGLKEDEKTRGGPPKGNVWDVVDTLKKHGDDGEMDNPDLKAMLEKELEISDKTARNLITQAKVEKYIGPIDPKARSVRWRILVGN